MACWSCRFRSLLGMTAKPPSSAYVVLVLIACRQHQDQGNLKVTIKRDVIALKVVVEGEESEPLEDRLLGG